MEQGGQGNSGVGMSNSWRQSTRRASELARPRGRNGAARSNRWPQKLGQTGAIQRQVQPGKEDDFRHVTPRRHCFTGMCSRSPRRVSGCRERHVREVQDTAKRDGA